MAKAKNQAGGHVRVRFPHLRKILDAMILEDRQVDVPLIMAPPGVGKTEFIEGYVKDKINAGEEWTLNSIILSQFDPTELKGFPYVSEDGEFHFAPLHTFPTLGPGFIFFDELTTSNKEVQNVILRLFSQMELGDYSLPPKVYMVCAANHVQDVGVFVHKLSTAMKTRVATYHLEPTFDDWKKWASKNDVSPEVIYFLEGHQDLLINIEADADSMPCPRTWVNLSNQLKRLKTLNYTDMEIMYPEMVARVGGNAAATFQTYIEVYSKVNVDDILQKGIFPQNIDDVNGGFAVTGALVGALKNDGYKLTETVAKNFIGCVDQMKEEFSVCLIGDLMKGTRFLDKLRRQLKGSSDREKYETLVDKFIEMLQDDA